MNDVRVKELIEAHRQLERYAGELERAVERVQTVCKLADGASFAQLADVVDLINVVTKVKDPRTRLFTGLDLADAALEQG